MLDSDYLVFNDLNNMLLYEVATFLDNLVKIGTKISERHQFIEMHDGGNRHVGFRLPGDYRYHRCVFIHSRNIPTRFCENWGKIERTISVLEIQNGCGRHLDDYTSG